MFTGGRVEFAGIEEMSEKESLTGSLYIFRKGLFFCGGRKGKYPVMKSTKTAKVNGLGPEHRHVTGTGGGGTVVKDGSVGVAREYELWIGLKTEIALEGGFAEETHFF